MAECVLLVLAVAFLLRGTESQDQEISKIFGTGGWNPDEDLYPWIVGVYYRRDSDQPMKHICGGSLISEEVVISAAHCFWNGGQQIPLNEYRITAGNYYRDITNPESKQICEINDIKIHERYRDQQLYYAHDIAIVWLKEKVVPSTKVKPIALDWNNEFDDLQLKDQIGTVVGWGYTDDDKPSTVRVAVKLPYIDFDACWKTVPQAFQTFITPDKFCAGHRNGTAVCPGDSGGGLAFQHPTSQIWYLRGIVSVGVTPRGEDKCFKTQYSAFTSIASNYLWLKKNLNKGEHRVEHVPIVFPGNP